MGSLKKFTKQRDGDAYIRMLLKAWQFSSNVYDNDFGAMEKYLTDCDAFLPHKEGKLKIIPR